MPGSGGVKTSPAPPGSCRLVHSAPRPDRPLGARLEPGGQEESPSSLKKGPCPSRGTGTPLVPTALGSQRPCSCPGPTQSQTGAPRHLLWLHRPPLTSQSHSLGKAEALLGPGPDTVVQQRHLRPDLGSGLRTAGEKGGRGAPVPGGSGSGPRGGINQGAGGAAGGPADAASVGPQGGPQGPGWWAAEG